MEIISFIAAHWLEWLFTAVLAALSWLFKLMRDQLRQEQERNKAIAEVVQSLLRESIVNNYNPHSGEMARSAYVRSTKPFGNVFLYYWVNEKGEYEKQWDTAFPHLELYEEAR